MYTVYSLRSADITSCATFNPVYPWLIASTSGQRKFEVDDDDTNSEDDTSMTAVDNSLKVWRVCGRSEWYTYDASAYDSVTTTEVAS